MDPNDRTAPLLERWHAGDRAALDELLAMHMPWLQHWVRTRLKPDLRARAETVDFVQDAVIDVLRYAPRFVIEDADGFRGLLARIVENNLHDAHDWFAAKRRALSRETQLPRDSVLRIHTGGRSVTRPSQAAERAENQSWIRLALELLDPEDRKVILLRQWDELPFGEIAQQMGIAENAARMRFQRALPKLARAVTALQEGSLRASADEADASQ